MHFASALSTDSTSSPLRRLWSCLLLVLGLCLMDAAHAGKTYSFDGGKVLNCSNKAKVYTCPTLQLPEWDDKMVIGDGYTVDVNADIGFGWNHGLRMSGTARLTSTGSINLTGLAPGSLVVNGGSFEAGGTFSVAGPTPFKADVIAGTLSLGTGTEIQITGKMVSRGAVSVASYATIVGPVSGTSIVTNSPFKITGEVKASDTLLIASGAVIDGPVSGTNSITINSPATLSSTVTSQGPVQIGSHANIGGAVKGTVITADSPVTLKGDVTATSRFTLGSGSTVNGNIVAPEVELYASQSNITGNITASKLLTMGDSVKVKGTVDTGTLTMNASNAMIEGIAKVDFATLYWNGRVTQPIVCKAGTRPGYCDCVDNQSGNPVNTANGPRCEGAKPPAGALDHFLISHDGSGSVCAPESVTVTACANADCSSNFTGGAQVKLFPGNVSADTGSTGTVKATVSSNTVVTEALRLTSGGTTPVRCLRSPPGEKSTSSCDMSFAGAGFDIKKVESAPPARAGESITAVIKAREKDANNNACVAKFKGETINVEYSCAYLRPSSGSEPLNVTREGSIALACATGTTKTLATRFNEHGDATVTLTYEDAGELSLKAKSGEVKGDATFGVAPYKFSLAAPAAPIRAGDTFNVAVSALSKNNKITKSFDKTMLPSNTTSTKLSLACVRPAGARNGQLDSSAFEFDKGEATAPVSWNEVGSMQLAATTANAFLDTGLTTTGSTQGAEGADACASVGPVIPKYFLVEQWNEPRKLLDFFYAGEPIPIKVTAMNAAGQATENYSAGILSQNVTLSAYDKDGKSANPNGGVLGAAAIEAGAFAKGVARANPTYSSPADANGKRLPLAPGVMRLRAQNADNTVGSGGDDSHEKAQPEIRSGRLRIATLFGRAGSTLDLPVTAEYWSGKSWLFNSKDDFTVISAAAIAQTPHAHAHPNSSGAKPKTQVFSDLKLEAGEAKLPVQGDTAGWIDIAFNLGAGAGLGPDQSCLSSHPQTSFANLPWLQSLSGCTDPSGRATFGIFAPESRRIIHIREVFN